MSPIKRGFHLSFNAGDGNQPYQPLTEPLTCRNCDEDTPLGAILFTLCEMAEDAEAGSDDDCETAYERACHEFDANFDHYHRLAFSLLTAKQQIEARSAGYAPADFSSGEYAEARQSCLRRNSIWFRTHKSEML